MSNSNSHALCWNGERHTEKGAESSTEREEAAWLQQKGKIFLADNHCSALGKKRGPRHYLIASAHGVPLTPLSPLGFNC